MRTVVATHRVLSKVCILTVALAIALTATQSTQAVSYWWDTTITSAWSTSANWWTTAGGTVSGVAPGSADTVIFNGTGVNGATTVTLDSPTAALGMTFANTNTTTLLSDGTARTLTLGTSGITINAGAGAVTLGDGTTAGNDVLMNLVVGNQSWVNYSANAFTIDNTVATITRSAGATLNFNQANAGTFVMSTTVVPNDATGIIGPWASFGTGVNTKYATNNAGTIAGCTGTAAASAANLTDTTGTVNYDLALATGTVPASMSANTIRFTGAAGTTAPGATLFSVNGLLNAGTGLWTIGTNQVTVGASKELVINAANNAITISSPIWDNGAGASSLTKTDSNTLTLSGANAYTGGTNVNAGTLLISGASALPATGALQVNAGGTLSLADATARSTTVAGLALAGGKLQFDWLSTGTVVDTLSTAALATASGNVGIILSATTPTASGGNLIMAASGLSGAKYFLANNTNYTATLTQSDTTVGISSYAAVTAPTSFYWKGGQVTGAGMVMAFSDGNGASNKTNWVTASGGSTATTVVPGSGAVIFNSTGGANNAGVTLGANMSVSSVTFSSPTTLDNDGNTLTTGSLAANSPVTLGANVIVGGGDSKITGSSSLNITGNFQCGNGKSNFQGGLTINWSGTGNLPGGNWGMLGDTGGATLNVLGGSLTWNPTTVDVGNGQGATMSVSGGIFTTTSGVRLGGAYNTDAGTGTGTLNISGNGLFTTGTSGGGFSFATGGGSTLNLNGGTLSTLRTFTTSTTNGKFNFNGGTLQATGNNSDWIQNNITTKVKVGGAIIDTQTFAAAIARDLVEDSGSTGGGLTKYGTGALTLSGSNTYTGATTISAGTLQTTKTASLPGQTTVHKISVASGATLAVNIGGLNEFAAGDLDNLRTYADFNTNSALALDTTNASGGTFAYNSNISDTTGVAGTLAITKLGVNTLVLGGANSYTGATTVIGGQLNVTNAGNLGATAGLTVGASGRFNWLPATPGTLSLPATALTLAGGSTIGEAFGSTLAATPAATTAGTVNLAPSGSFTSGTEYMLLTAASGLDTATYRVLNPTNYTFTLALAADSVKITPTTATMLPTAYWKGGLSGNAATWAASTGAASNWTTDSAGSVTTGQVPGAATDVIFSATGAGNQGAMILGTDMAINSLTVNNTAAVTLNNTVGYTLTIGSAANPGVKVNAASGIVTLNSNIAMGAAQCWTNNSSNTLAVAGNVDNGGNLLTVDGTGSTTISGIVSNTGGLTQSSSGTLTLSGANTYGGDTTISTGKIKVVNATALGVSGVSVTGGAVLDVNGTTMTNTNTLTLNGTGISSSGALTNSSATSATYAGLLTLGSTTSIVASSGNITISNAGTITGSDFGLTLGGTAPGSSIASIIGTGAGTLTKTGAGTWILTNDNTYSGDTTISGGTLQIGNGGATGSLNASSVISNSSVLKFNRSGTLTQNNVISGSGTLIQSGSGTVVLNGDSSYTGVTTISGGVLSVSNLQDAGSNSNLGAFAASGAAGLVLSGGTLQYTGASDVSVNRGFTLSTANSTIDVSPDSTALFLGASSLGAFTLNVTGGSGSSLGLDATTLIGAATLSPTTANLTVASFTGTYNLTLGGTATGNSVTGAIGTGAGTLLKSNTGTWTLSGNNTYSGLTTVNGAGGALVLAGNNNGATGGTTITAGTLRVGAANNFTTGALILNGGILDLSNDTGTDFAKNVTVAASSIINVHNATSGMNQTHTVGALSIGAFTLTVTGAQGFGLNTGTATFTGTTGGITNNAPGLLTVAAITANNAAAKTITLSGSGDITVSGAITQSGTTPTTNITKTGTGTLTLSAANSYTGATAVNGGTLALGVLGTTGATLAATAVTVTNGIFAVTPGVTTTANSSIGSSLTLNAGSAFTMADGVINQFNVAGAATLAPASGIAPNLYFDFGSTPSAVDKLAITGIGTIGAAKAKIYAIPTDTAVTTGSAYTIITAGSGLTTGNFALGNPNVVVNGIHYTVALGGTATTETLTFTAGSTPAPSAYWTGGTDGSWATINGTTSVTNFTVDTNGFSNTVVLPDLNTNATLSANTAGNLATTLDQAFTINSLTFSGTGTSNTTGSTINAGTGGSASTLTINAAAINGNTAGNGMTVNTGAGANTVGANVVLGAAQTWTNNSTSMLTVSGDIDNGANLLTIAGTGSTTLGGNLGSGVTKTGGLTKSGAGILTLSGSSSYTGTTTIGGGTIAVSGGDDRLPNAGTVNFSAAGTLDVGSTSQTLGNITVANTVTGTVDGSGGTLVLGTANFSIGGNANSGTATLRLSGLEAFNYDGSTKAFNVSGTYQHTSANGLTPSSSGVLTLAGNNTITAASVNVGNGNGSNAGFVSGTINLGLQNNLNSSTVNVGAAGGKTQGTLKFNTGLGGTPALVIRGLAGGSTRADMNVGVVGSGNLAFVSSVDLVTGYTGGTALDAMLGTLTIAFSNRPSAVSPTVANATFAMGGGILDATNIALAADNANDGAGGGANGTFTLGVTGGAPGGTVKVGTLKLGDRLGAGTITSTFNLNNGGTLAAQSIQAGAGTATRTLNWNDGTIRNLDASTDLTFGNGITVKLAATGTHAFDIDADRSANVASVMVDAAALGTLTKLGTGTLTLSGGNTYTGDTTVSSGKLLLGQGGSMAATAVGVTGTATYGVSRTTSGSSVAGGATLNLASGTVLDLQDSNTNTMAFTGAGTLSGATLKFDLGTSVGDILALGDAATISGTNTFAFNALGGTLNSTYTLITAPSGLSMDGFSLGSYGMMNVGGTYYNMSLTADATHLYLGAMEAALNNSVITVDGTNSAEHTEKTVYLGNADHRVLVGSPALTTTATVTMHGTAGTTYTLTPTGGATANPEAPEFGVFSGFDNPDAQSVTVGLSGATLVDPGLKTGTVTVTNTGSGVSDADDTITVQTTAVALRVVTADALNFGPVHAGTDLSTLTKTATFNSTGSHNVATDVTVDGTLTFDGVSNSHTKSVTGIAGSVAGSGTFYSAPVVTAETGLGDTYSNVAVDYTATVYSGIGVWNTTGTAAWSNFGNWTTDGGAPGLAAGFQTGGDTATFSGAGGTVTLDASPTVGSVTFGGTANYTIAGSGTLTLPGAAINNVISIATDRTATIDAKISGTGITKTGKGKLVLNGANDYAGLTTVTSGVLELGLAAQNNVIGTTGGRADIKAGKLVFDYATGTTPAAEILAILDASYGSPLQTPFAETNGAKIYSSTGTFKALGWADDTTAKKVTVMYTLFGDATLDGTVNFDDLNKVLTSYNQGGTWGTGDFTYDGQVNFDDLNKVLTAYNTSLGLTETISGAGLDGQAINMLSGSGITVVPEPSSVVLLLAGLMGLLAYGWRKRK